MSVRINVAADASQVTKAFDQIRAAIRQAGQEGRDFADLDLSHPELQALGKDIERMQRQFMDLQKLGRGGAASAVRGMAVEDPLGWLGQVGKVFPSAGQQNTHVANIGRYLLNGTKFQLPPAPPAPGPPAPRGGKKDDEEKGIAGFAGSLLKKYIPFALGLAGVQGVASTIKSAVSGAQEWDVATDALMRRINDTNASFDMLKGSASKTADALHLTQGEVTQLGTIWERQTGERDAGKIYDGVKDAAGLARGMGMDASGTVAALSHASMMGVDPRIFAEMLASAVHSGFQGQPDEARDAMVRYLDQSSRMFQGGHLEDYMGMLTGLQAYGRDSKDGAFQGGNAAAALDTINNSITSGGGGNMGVAALFSRMFAANGVTDPIEQQKLREQGMYARLPNGKSLLDASYGRVQEETKGMPADYQDAIMEQAFGNPMAFWRTLRTKHINAGRMDWMKVQLDKVDPGLDFSKLSADSIGGISELLTNGTDLDAYRERLHKSGQLTGSAYDKLKGENGEELQRGLIDFVAANGKEQTEGSKVADSIADLKKATVDLGSLLVEPLNDIRQAARGILVDMVALATNPGKVLKDGFPMGVMPPDLQESLNAWLHPPGSDFKPGANNGVPEPVLAAAPAGGWRGPAHPGAWHLDYGLIHGPASSRGLDNNNPLNLRFNAHTPAPGAVGGDRDGLGGAHTGGMAVFDDMATGVAGDMNQLLLDQDRGAMTIADLVKAWEANPNENDIEGNTKKVAANMGMKTTDRINLRDPKVAMRFFNAMSMVEGSGVLPKDGDLSKGLAMAYKRRPDPGLGRIPGDMPALGGKPGDYSIPYSDVAGGSGGAAAPTQHVRVEVAPIKVQHVDPKGRVIKTDYHPATVVPAVKPSGTSPPAPAGMLPKGF